MVPLYRSATSFVVRNFGSVIVRVSEYRWRTGDWTSAFRVREDEKDRSRGTSGSRIYIGGVDPLGRFSLSARFGECGSDLPLAGASDMRRPGDEGRGHRRAQHAGCDRMLLAISPLTIGARTNGSQLWAVVKRKSVVVGILRDEGHTSERFWQVRCKAR